MKLDPTKLQLDPAAIYKKLDAASTDWVEFNAIAENLDKECKEVLAILILDSTQSTVEGRKNEALVNPEYMQKKADEIEAKKEALKAKRKIQDIETYIEIWRTLEATKRAEMKL